MFIKMWKGETNLQQKSQVLHDDIGVIVCLEEPVGVVTVMLVDVRECSTRFAPQIIVTFRHVEPDSRQLSVSLRAHEQQYVTSEPHVAFTCCALELIVSGPVITQHNTRTRRCKLLANAAFSSTQIHHLTLDA